MSFCSVAYRTPVFDVHNLKKSDIRDGYIEITTVKTAERLIIELNNHSKAILDKYKGVEFEGHKALPCHKQPKDE